SGTKILPEELTQILMNSDRVLISAHGSKDKFYSLERIPNSDGWSLYDCQNGVVTKTTMHPKVMLRNSLKEGNSCNVYYLSKPLGNSSANALIPYIVQLMHEIEFGDWPVNKNFPIDNVLRALKHAVTSPDSFYSSESTDIGELESLLHCLILHSNESFEYTNQFNLLRNMIRAMRDLQNFQYFDKYILPYQRN